MPLSFRIVQAKVIFMLKTLTSKVFLLISIYTSAQVSSNVNLLGNWDDNTLRVQSGLSYNDIWGYTDENFNEYGIIGSVSYTHFIDLRNPATPREISRIAGTSNSLWRDIKTYRHYAYSVADNGSGSLQIFDLSDLPNSVTKVYDSQVFFSNCHNIFIDEANSRLYAVGTNRAHIVVLNLKSDPANPTLMKNITLSDGYIHDIYVRDHIAYASHIYKSKLTVYNLVDLNNIQALGSFSNYTDAGLNHSSWLSENGETLVMADENHGARMKVVDVSDLTDIKETATFKSTLEASVATNSIAHNPFVIGDQYVVVSYYHEGVQIYDIANPSNPFKVGYYDTYPNNTNYSGFKGSWGVFPFFPSGNIIASDINNGLFVLKPTFDLGYCRKMVYSARPFETDEKINTHSSTGILLENGFHAKGGSEFSAIIQDCPLPLNTNTIKPEVVTIEDIELSVETEKANNHLVNLELSAYPNPFSDEFKLTGRIITDLPNSSIRLFNNLMQEVLFNSSNCGENCVAIQTKNLNTGIYTVIIQERRGGKIQMKKVIKY